MIIDALPPLSELTPAKAALEFAQARFLLGKCDEQSELVGFAKLTTRYARSQTAGLLPDESVVDRVWEAAEVAGLLDRHGHETLQNVLVGALEVAETQPSESDHPLGSIRASAYVWTDPKTMPRREWLYGHLLIRKFVSATIAPGGVGKSSLIVAETLAGVSGRDLLGVTPRDRLRVWLWNLEDPQEETTRKIQAACLRHGLTRDDLGDRLFVDSGRDQALVIATSTKNGTVIVRPVVDALSHQVIEKKIDVVVIDPFVSCHQTQENDNTGMDMIAKEWAKVADRCNCAIHLVHHTRKGEVEVTLESSRGGKALTDACRVVRVVNRMSSDEAERAGVENHRLYFRTFNDKASLTPPADKSDWFHLESIDIGNAPINIGGIEIGGDKVGVVSCWSWPDPLEGMTAGDFDKVAAVVRRERWREHSQAGNWVGRAVAEALELNADSKADRAKIKGMLGMWLSAGSLRIVEGIDEKRMPRKFVEVSESD